MAQSNYDILRNKLEEEKFNKAIQLSNAKSQALKNTQNQMQQMGYGSQGYGANEIIKTNNIYQNLQSQNNSDYWTRLQEINQQENNDYVTNANDNYMSFLENADGMNGKDFLATAKDYGYNFVKNNNGQYVLDSSSTGYDYLTQAQINEMNLQVNNKDMSAIGSREAEQATNKIFSNYKNMSEYTSVNDLKNITKPYLKYDYLQAAGGADTLGGYTGVNKQLNKLQEMVSNNEVPDNTLICLDRQNDGGSSARTFRFYVLYKNGKFYVVSNSNNGNAKSDKKSQKRDDDFYNNYNGRKLRIYNYQLSGNKISSRFE